MAYFKPTVMNNIYATAPNAALAGIVMIHAIITFRATCHLTELTLFDAPTPRILAVIV